MNEKTILSVASPLTKSAEAVKQLIEYETGQPCEELPATYALANGAQLTRSKKGDVFYVTTPTNCSCPACKHQRKYFTQPVQILNLADELRAGEKWAGDMNWPMNPSELKVVT